MPSVRLTSGLCCVGLLGALGALIVSAPVAAADEAAVPAVVVVPADSALHVAWAPFTAADQSVNGYDVTATPSDLPASPVDVTAPADAGGVDVTGLANGVSYDVSVTAVAADGSRVAAPGTPVGVPRTVPGRPMVTSATGLDGAAQLTWSAPADDGGSPVTGYVVDALPSGASVTVPADARTAVVPGLANGAPAALQVVAVNDAGNGVSSNVTAATPRKPARIVATAVAKPVVYGGTSTVAAQLLGGNGAAVANTVVELRALAAHTTTWRTLGRAATNGAGRVTFRTAFSTDTRLLLHHTADAVVAPDVAVGNVAVSYRVTAPTRPKAVRVRHLVAVTGQVRPAQTPGTKVLLQRWSSGAWRTVATGRTAAHSNYRVTWTPGQPGSNALRVVKPRDAVRSAGTSATWHQKISPENAADIAADILRNKRVTLAIVHESGVRDGATVLQNIRDVAHGRLAHRSAYQNAPGGSTAVKLGLLRAIRQMGSRLHVSVSEIAGGSHAPDSGHYQGRAVDVNVVNGVSVAGGASYGVVVSICHANGATTVFDPGYDPFGGHSNHVHCGWN